MSKKALFLVILSPFDFAQGKLRQRVYTPKIGKILTPYPLLGSMIGFSRVFRSTKIGIPFLKTLNNCNENNIK